MSIVYSEIFIIIYSVRAKASQLLIDRAFKICNEIEVESKNSKSFLND